MWIGTTAQLLDVYFDGAEEQMQEIADSDGVFVVNNTRIRKDVDGAAVGGLNDGFRLRVGHQFIPDPDCLVYGQRPARDTCPPNRQITRDADDAALSGQRGLRHRGIARPSQKRERNGNNL